MPLIDSQTKKLKEKLTEIKHEEEEKAAKQFAAKLNLPYVDLSTIPVDSDSLSLLAKEKAEAGEMLVIRKTGQVLRLAVKNPGSPKTDKIIKELQQEGYQCKLFIVSLTSLRNGWKRYELTTPKAAPIRGALIISKEELDEFKENIQTIQQLKKTISNLSTSRLLNIILAGAIEMKSSDIHFEPGKKGIELRYRIDGLLQSITDFPQKDYRFCFPESKLSPICS